MKAKMPLKHKTNAANLNTAILHSYRIQNQNGSEAVDAGG